MKKKRRWLKVLLVVLALGVLACVWEFASSQNPYLLGAKRTLKYDILHLSTENRKAETAGLAQDYTLSLYGDGNLLNEGFTDETDRKAVYEDGAVTRLVNYLDGYQLDFPAGTRFDFTLSPLFTRAEGDGFDATVSREQATYASKKDILTFELSTFLPFLVEDYTVRRHVDYYEYRFLLDPGWQQNNRVSVEQWQDGDVWLISAVLQDPGDAVYDGYLYATVFTGSREYLRVMYRYHTADAGMRDALAAQAAALRAFDPTGTGVCATDYAPELPENWSGETADLYREIAGGDRLRWGIFAQDIFTTGIRETIPRLEESLDYHFDVILAYFLLDQEFPAEFMRQNYEDGRIVELTLQITDNNNENMFARTPFLDIYRGELDDRIRAIARAAADFGHPFLFRLNNEMNSDWTSYSGVVNMADPQLFVSVWQRIYRIFQEEGADNCIWIFNPNDRNAPPSRWNDSLAYYPGNGYTQVLGVTGYNNGTYYTQWAEQWREFDQIYNEIQDQYLPHFASFPWMITEFASSSVGGDKAAWIDHMFAHIGDYPNIKIAVWFSYADFDGDTPARPYWLDETPETLEAFRRGLAQQAAG